MSKYLAILVALLGLIALESVVVAQAPPRQTGRETSRVPPRPTPPQPGRQPVTPTNPFGPVTPAPSAGDQAAGCGACAACAGVWMAIFIGIPVAAIILNVCLLIWVGKDAKARGMDNAVMWMVLVGFTGLVGLIIYVASRTQGNLIACLECRNKRLEVSRRCPHCGNA